MASAMFLPLLIAGSSNCGTEQGTDLEGIYHSWRQKADQNFQPDLFSSIDRKKGSARTVEAGLSFL